VRWGLIGCWVVVLAVMPFVSENTADWSDVRDLVASGKVQSVQIDHELPAEATGSTEVTIHWQRGPFDYVTTVREIRGDSTDGPMNYADDDVTATLHTRPSSRLLELQPGLNVTRGQGHDYYDNKFVGFVVPAAIGYVAIALGVAAFLLLVEGPQPWRATHWAWLWLFSNPIGMACFLLLSGPVPGLRAPRNVKRRLTGGWAFLLSIVLSSMTVSFGFFGW
jgi:hypothetical protein